MKKYVALLSVVLSLLMVQTASATTSVYLIGNGDSQDTAVKNILTNYGFAVTIGDSYNSFKGSSSLNSYNAVLLAPEFTGGGSSMPDAGQTALLNYVKSGGGLVTTEWTFWVYSQGRFATLGPALPASSGGAYDYYSSATYTKNVTNPTIDFNLPDSFTFSSLHNMGGTESQLTPKGGATVFFNSTYGGSGAYGGLVGWTYGSGHVISFSILADQPQPNSNFNQLLANSVNWAEGTPVPVPGTLLLLGSGLLGLAGLGRRKFSKS